MRCLIIAKICDKKIEGHADVFFYCVDSSSPGIHNGDKNDEEDDSDLDEDDDDDDMCELNTEAGGGSGEEPNDPSHVDQS